MDKLKEYLRERDENITDFSRRSGIAINTLRRILIDGKQPKKGTAKRIVKCTKKAISMRDFGYE